MCLLVSPKFLLRTGIIRFFYFPRAKDQIQLASNKDGAELGPEEEESS
jgi:hypothetical protein